MSSSSRPDYGEITDQAQVEIDDLCDRFEAELKLGRRPNLDDFLQLLEQDARETLAAELLAIELHYHGGESETIRESYTRRFPALLPAREAAVHISSADRSIASGTRLGEFRIEEELGEGGMGVVYKAHDMKLDRTVALKLLSRHFAEDQQRLARFQREAKIVAGLNHPNIATLYEFGEHDGVQFLVLEFVPGMTLAQVLGSRRMPIRDIVPIFVQIAEALESAHEVGVVHRDLKPANIKVTPDGLVKVLDFGLARSTRVVVATADGNESRHADHAATDSTDRTRESGVQTSSTTGISGTLPYMSPERAGGKPVDKRCDVWSYGCCLYEALAGQRAFPGQTATEVASAISERPPDWKMLRNDTPEQLVRLLKRCLEKDPRQRLRDMGDARIELVDYQARAPVEQHSRLQKRRQQNRRLAKLILSTAFVSTVISVAVMWSMRAPESQPAKIAETRSSVNLPPGLELAGMAPVAISPDGSRWAYVAAGDDGVTHIYVQARNQTEARKLDGTEFAESPFFSPNGQRIAFFAGNRLNTISVSGGTPTMVCRASFFGGGCWSADHGIVFSFGWGNEFDQVSPDGKRRSLTLNEISDYGWPQSLPSGEILFVSYGKVLLMFVDQIGRANDQPGVREIELIRRVGFARYMSTGHLVYASNGSLFAVPFALNPARVTGEEILIADDVATHRTYAEVAVSESGDIAYIPGKSRDAGELVWGSRENNEAKPAWQETRKYSSLKLSPDGKRLAIGVIEDDGCRVWIYDFETGNRALLTSEGQSERPIWAPDGKRVVFQWNRDGNSGLYWTVPGSQEGPELLTASHARSTPVCFSDNGKKLIFYSGESGARGDIHEMTIQTGAVTRLISSPDQDEAFGDLSPDGQWLVYLSTSANRDYEVFVGRYPEMKEVHRVSSSGGLDPMWSASDENTIFFWQGNVPYGRVMAATIAFDPFHVSIEPAVTEISLDLGGYAYDYDPKNDRFLLVRPSGEITPRTKFRLLQNSLGP